MKVQYHIDVTPEEDLLFREVPEKKSSNKIKIPLVIFNRTFLLVLSVHIMIALSLIRTSFAYESNQKIDLSQPVAEIPSKVFTVKDSVIPKKETNITPRYTTTYVVKPGDTIFSISRKYKLNVNKLIQLNNLKDPNSIKVGQILKFM